jgi:tRNA(Ile)-lysidine synthetase-like protein
VRALAERVGIDVVVGRWDAPRLNEAAARIARYAFLRDVALRHRADAVVTGHTADDQTETVLMHALRGAGLHGLAGMLPDAPSPGGDPALRIWRPLLDVWRRETRAYCDASGIRYVDDASNDDRRFHRNRLRLDVVPQMQLVLPDVGQRLLAMARGARSAAHALDVIGATVLIDGPSEHAVLLERSRLATLPPEAVPHAFRLAVVRLLGDARDFERKHYQILERAAHGATGAAYQLPRGVVATVDATRIVLSVGTLPSPPVTNMEHALPFEGVAGAWRLRVRPAGEATMADGGIDLRLPAGTVVRPRRPGDRVRLRAGSKKLADWYIDRKVPRRERESAPVIAYGNQVLWTPWGALGELPHGTAWRIVSSPVAAAAPGSRSG